MRVLLCLFTLIAAIGYSDDGSAQKQAMQEAFQKLIKLDEQIENLEKKKLQIKGEAAEEMKRASEGLLPRMSRRQARQAEQSMQEIQNINGQLQGLEEQRQAVIMALK